MSAVITNTRKPGVIEQFRKARKNPFAALLGAAFGGSVPFFTFYGAHVAMNWDAVWTMKGIVALGLILGGLAFSASTVYEWVQSAFGCGQAKALCYVFLMEGTMMVWDSWITQVALGYLIVINAVNYGYHMASDDKGLGKTAKKTVKRTTKRKTTTKKAAA